MEEARAAHYVGRLFSTAGKCGALVISLKCGYGTGGSLFRPLLFESFMGVMAKVLAGL
jgi:hypothetical protein